MSSRTLASRAASRRRRSWSIFWAGAVTVLGTCFFAALRSSGATSAGLVLIGGSVVVGIAAALMYSVVSPLPAQLASGQRMRGGFDGGGADVTGSDSGG